MTPSFFSLVGRQWAIVRCDRWLLALVSWVPLLLFFLVWAIFSQQIARNLPIGVVDLDNSRLSRALVRHYDANPTLTMSAQYVDVQHGATALRTGEIYAVVIIPVDLEKKTSLGQLPAVTAFVNSQYLLIGKSVNTALSQAHATFATQLAVQQNLLGGTPIFARALATALPINSKIVPLFNSNSNYGQFLVPILLPAIWQILLVVTTVLFVFAAERYEGFAAWLGTTPIRNLLAGLLPLIALLCLQGLFFLWLGYVFMGLPMHGSWLVLLVAQLATVCASVSVALLLCFMTLDAARSLSLGAAYAAPGLAFMGVTFPVTDMNLPARIWRSLLPISHYIEIQLGQANYGAPWSLALPQLQQLGWFLLPLVLVFYRVRRLGSRPPGEVTKEGRVP